MADVVTPLLAAGSNVAQSFLNYNSQKEANKLNIRLARERNAQQVALMREQNKFNSPETQAALMQYAGINPSGVQQGSASSTPDLATPQVTPPQLDMQAMQLALQGAQVEKTKAETNNINKDADLKRTQSELNSGLVKLNDFNLKIKALDLDFNDKSLKPRLDLLNQQLEDFKQSINKKKAEVDTLLFDLTMKREFDPQIFQKRIRALSASAEDSFASAAYRKLQSQFYPSYINSFINNLESQKGLYTAQSKLVSRQSVQQGFLNRLTALNWQFQYYDFLAKVGYDMGKVQVDITPNPFGKGKHTLFTPSDTSILRKSYETQTLNSRFERDFWTFNRSLDISGKIMDVISKGFGCFRDFGIGSQVFNRGLSNPLSKPDNMQGAFYFPKGFDNFEVE